MAGTYYTDLFILNQVESPSSDGSISEFTGATAGGTGGNQGKTDETDFFIQGAQCVSKSFNATGIGGYGYDNGSSFNVPTDGAVYTWTYWAAPNSVSGKSTGGHQIHLGNSTSAYRRFYVDGSDTQEYGGWKCYPINYGASANGTTTDQGSPTGATQVIGYAVNNASNISKGNPYGLDVMRYGRGTIAVDSSVDSATADFTTIASYNDKNSTGAVTGFNLIQTGFHRLGIFSLQNGVFQLQGRLLLGQGSVPITTEASGTLSASPVTFSDSNKTIFIQDSEFCQTGFNLIEIQNTSSSVTLSNISIDSLAGVAGNPARGNFLVTDAASVALSSCTFQNMGAFSLNTGTTATSCNFNTCSTVVQNGAQLTSCNFNSLATVNQGANVIVDTDTNLDGCNFVGGGFHYAVDIGNVSDGGSFNWNSTFDSSTFATSSRTASSTGSDSEVIGLNLSGGTFTINVNNGVAAPTYHNRGSGTVVIANNVSLAVEGLLGNSEVRIYNNPSTLTGGGTATEAGGVETVAATTATGNGTNSYIFYNTGGSNVVVSVALGNFTATELADGDKFRVLVRDNADNPTLQLFDEFTVSGTPTTTSITTTTLSSGFTSTFGAVINGANSKTVTVEKVNATETFSLSAGTYDIAIFRTASQPIYFLGRSVSANGSIPVTQVVDRVYNNPV